MSEKGEKDVSFDVVHAEKTDAEAALSNNTSSQSACSGARLLVSFDDLPAWYADNRFIKTGYRPELRSFLRCLASWTYIHNETYNIFSHLIPSVLALISAFGSIAFLVAKYPDATGQDRFTFAFFLASAAICLGLSASYHTLMCHSERISGLCLRLDFLGILTLIFGAFVSAIPMAFYCEATLRKVYWAMIGSLSFLTAIFLITPRFQTQRWRTVRICLFVGTGLSGIAPIIHAVKIFGLSQSIKQTGLPYYLLEGVLFIAGCGFYAFRFPERLKPGRFDIWGNSHQIFHSFVVAGTVAHLVGILMALEYNVENRRCHA